MYLVCTVIDTNAGTGLDEDSSRTKDRVFVYAILNHRQKGIITVDRVWRAYILDLDQFEVTCFRKPSFPVKD